MSSNFFVYCEARQPDVANPPRVTLVDDRVAPFDRSPIPNPLHGVPRDRQRIIAGTIRRRTASRAQASMTALFRSRGMSGSNGRLLADFAQDLVEDTKRFPHLGPVALTMPFFVDRLAPA